LKLRIIANIVRSSSVIFAVRIIILFVEFVSGLKKIKDGGKEKRGALNPFVQFIRNDIAVDTIIRNIGSGL